MKRLYRRLLGLLSQVTLVEFDYRDKTGLHHGRCFVRCLFGSKQRMKRMLRSFGYTNIHIL